jgi:predicted alpha/beta hydrolase family esterase
MSNVFIIHGVGGHPQENWFPWVKSQLEALGHKVFVPQFPTPENQNLEAWFKELKNYQEFINEDTVFIGHSLGVPFILNIAEKYKIKAAFLVAGFTGVAGNKFDDSMKTFAQRQFNWKQILDNCQHFTVFHSDNDPYVSLQKAQELAMNLQVSVNLLKGAGHFNSAVSYNEFPHLIEEFKRAIGLTNLP